MTSTEPDFVHHMVTTGGLNMHCVELGQGEPLVLLHGFPQHWWMWRRVMPLLATRHRVIAVDQRGMGGTEITSAGYDKSTLARDLRALLDALEVPQAHIVGYDLGGGTAFAHAHLFAAATRTLTLLEFAPPGFGYEYGMQPVPNWQAWQLAFFTVPDVAVQFIAGKERELLAWYFWHWSHNPDAIVQDDFEVYVRQLQKPGALRAGFSYFATVFEDMAQVKTFAQQPLAMPVLALGGERGAANFVLGAAQRLATHAEGGIVERAGHWLADEQPEALAQRLLAFTAQHPIT